MRRHRYEFSFGEQTAYARVAAMVERRFGAGEVVLDVGCGFGALAEPCRAAGYTYVGIDQDPAGLKDLVDRGFEASQVTIEATTTFTTAIQAALGGRSLAGILMLDVIEHVTDAVDVLGTLREIAVAHDAAPLILCLPNVTHFDVGAKLIQGHWDQTEVGILDDTHVGFYDENLLQRTTHAAGWHQVDSDDFKLEESDQHFPKDNIALLPGTPLNSVLRDVRVGAGSGADVCQFIRAFVPGPRSRQQVSLSPASTSSPAPFLSVLTRTQGNRLETLQETLLCLAAQSCPDFEVLVLAHNVTPEQAMHLGYLVSSLSPAVSGKFRIVPVTGPGRCRPLNVGTQEARGQYIAVLDDDDLVMGNWVEVFRDLARQWPGRVLRATVAEQDICRGPWPDRLGYHVESGIRTPFPASFDLFDHLVENQSPPCGLAFPRSCFRDLGIVFDESLPVLEDWDVLLQSVLLSGIANSAEVTSIYRRWQTGESSTYVHSSSEWAGAHQAVIAKLDRRASIMPGGTITRVRAIQGELVAQRQELAARRDEIEALRAERDNLARMTDVLSNVAERITLEVHGSRSWRVTRPLRATTDMLRKARSR